MTEATSVRFACEMVVKTARLMVGVPTTRPMSRIGGPITRACRS